MKKNDSEQSHLKVLPARQIESVQFTGLTERLAQTNALAVLLETLEDGTDLNTIREISGMIMQAVDEAIGFAGIKPDEWATVTDYTMRGLRFDRE